MKNTYKINISGIELSVVTEYDHAYVEALAARTGEKIDAMMKHTAAYGKLQAALLCLMDETDAREHAEVELVTLRKKAETDRLDMEILQIENEKLTGKRRS